MSHASSDTSTNVVTPATQSPQDLVPTARRQGRQPTSLTLARKRRTGGLTRGLGWFSIGIGVAQLVAPRRIARLIGASESEQNLWRLRVSGALTAAAGVSLVGGWVGGPGPSIRRQPIQRSITVGRPPAEVYRYWHDFQNLPKFMVHLESVEVLDATHSYWRAKGPGGKVFDWNAEIVEDKENELISWRSIGTAGGSGVSNSGVVRFLPAPGGRGTEIHVEASYDAPGGVFGRMIALAVSQDPSQQIDGDLRRLKQVMEAGEITQSDASIHRGMHPARPSGAPRSRKGGGS